jgi:hypothetical protein
MAFEKKEFKVPANRLGTMMSSKENDKKYYIKVEQTMTLNKGDVLFVSKPSEDIDFLVKSGYIKEEDAEARKEKVPKFVKFYISKGSSSAKKGASDTEVSF